MANKRGRPSERGRRRRTGGRVLMIAISAAGKRRAAVPGVDPSSSSDNSISELRDTNDLCTGPCAQAVGHRRGTTRGPAGPSNHTVLHGLTMLSAVDASACLPSLCTLAYWMCAPARSIRATHSAHRCRTMRRILRENHLRLGVIVIPSASFSYLPQSACAKAAQGGASPWL